MVPLSLPGVFAGSLLVFIPAAGDFVNAYYLGSAKTTMIGNVVQNQFLVQVDYPVAAALSFVFMAIVMVIVIVYAPHPRHGGPGVRRPAVSEHSGTVTSTGGRDRAARWSTSRAGFALLYLFLPIFVIVAFSFNEPKGRFNAVWEQFTFENWLHPFADKALVDALIAEPRDRADRGHDRHDPRRRSSRSRSCATGSAAAAASTSCWCCR